jgi:hypothetical protein
MSTLTITLHWQDKSGPREANVVCEDSPPQALLPLLVTGCGLPTRDAQGLPLHYVLRTGSPGRPPLHPARMLSAQSVRDGAQLWLMAAASLHPAPAILATRCLLMLPDAWGEVVVPPRGLALERGWLLRALELLDPAEHRRELERLERHASKLINVSERPHCLLGRTEGGAWFAGTDRHDVATLLNDAPIRPGAQYLLADGDRLRLGEAGPVVTLVMV